ncbi:hypothetical protein FH972_024405 [Carpinus fangiana]|uniref:DUF7924 domain-containing protein n=1 Tax=Carpinus fangiana TaxID=176857 RepID=A0A5N6KXY4_9ROSI|nr:hypothetical protein FH972_024405 [Carpinus fangiana]
MAPSETGPDLKRHGRRSSQQPSRTRKSARLQGKQHLSEQQLPQEQTQQPPSPANHVLTHTDESRASRESSDRSKPLPSARKQTLRAGTIEHSLLREEDVPCSEQQQPPPQNYPHKDTSKQEIDSEAESVDPVQHWAQEGAWPQEYFEQDSNMSRPRGKKRPASSSSDQPLTTAGPSVPKGRVPDVNSLRYEKLLLASGIDMKSGRAVVPTNECKTLCQTLLDTPQTIPQDTLVNPTFFLDVCESVSDKNEARVVRDLTPLLVPSAEMLNLRGAASLKHLIDSVDETWVKCISIVRGPRPKPDFSVGLRSTAFTAKQLDKLKPSVGDWAATSYVVATDDMYFPFLTCEVKCGNQALDIADRHNAHSASIAVQAIVQLYRLVSRQHELHRKILAFSISHDNKSVSIYGHYAVVQGATTQFHRHRVRSFNFMEQDGRESWTAYRFTRNIYDIFVPIHVARIVSAVDKLPDSKVFRVETPS